MGRPVRDRELGWLSDIDSLVTLIRRGHWRYKDVDLPNAFQERQKRVRDSVVSWADQRVVVELQRMLATLNDGHTLVYPFGMNRGRLSYLPIALYAFDDGVAIIHADSTHADLIGRRVDSIGGVATAEVLERLAPYASTENTSHKKWVLPMYARFPDYLRAAGIATDSIGVWVRVSERPTPLLVRAVTESIDPAAFVVGLVPPPARPSAARPTALVRLDEPYWFARLGNRTVYVQFNRVVAKQGEGLDAFALRLLSELERDSTANLIVDVRYNSGGNAALLPPLVRAIIAFRVRNPDAAINVLIGRQTFSAAQTFVNRLEEYVSPRFIGEPSGSKPNRFGNELAFRLPFSGVLGGISSGYNQAATSRDARQFTPPSVAVGLTIAEWLSGEDPALRIATSRRDPR